MSGQRAKLKFQNCSLRNGLIGFKLYFSMYICINANILRKTLRYYWNNAGFLFLFFVKGVMVLNRFQKYVKVIESSKGPSTILETQLSLACYQISRGLKEPCSIKYLKYADHLSLWKTLSFELGIANICYSESFYYKGSHKKSFGVKNCFTVYD